MHDPITDEEAILENMRKNVEEVTLMPNHCINARDELQGFWMRVCANTEATSLCVNRTMFFGHTMFECVSSDHVINQDVVRLMGQDNVPQMHKFLASFNHKNCATFDCIPQNTDAVLATNDHQHFKVSYAKGKRSVDCKSWQPDCPQRVGLYHAMVRGYQKDMRQHKLFIVVSGGCSKCCDMFYNLMMDVGDQWTAAETYESEEVWWLRKACQRARCMIASRLAKQFGLVIKEYIDNHSYNPTPIAIPNVDTMEHNISRDDGYVNVYNHCCETNTSANGVLCQMNPTEGYWLFRGNTRSSVKSTNFGTLDGIPVFPTNAPLYKPGNGSPSFVTGGDNRLVVRASERAKNTVYQCYDEHMMRELQQMGWNRDHGVVELMPIIVGCGE